MTNPQLLLLNQFKEKEEFMGKEQLVVGLDIGTTKVCAIVGEMTENGIDIAGIGTHPSRGLRKGVVVNIEATVNSIRYGPRPKHSSLVQCRQPNTLSTGLV